MHVWQHQKHSVVSYRRRYATYELIIELSALADECLETVKENPELVMVDEDQTLKHAHASVCAARVFKEHDKTVRYHDCRTRSSRGAANAMCNINLLFF